MPATTTSGTRQTPVAPGAYNCVVHLDPTTCYRALQSRDRRFDGRFFTGVVTTGIYCRPICPAPTPRLRNCRFFAVAAAAEEAGFRPCLRCRPERSAGTPAWPDAPQAVARALALIADGALDDGASVETLAGRIGVGARQLRRMFDDHLGASPIRIAKARRVHLARALLDETSLPVARVAFAAGFGSVRQFNDDVRTTFRRTPTELRARARKRVREGDGLTLRLSYRPPYAWDALVAFLGARATRGVEAVRDGAYLRAIAVDGAAGTIEVRPIEGEGALALRVRLPSYDGLAHVIERARRLFDIGADPLAIGEHLARDPMLVPLVAARPGLRVPGSYEPFETAVRAILGQQISVRAATAAAGRVAAAFGKPVEGFEDDGITHLFPDAATLAGADLTGVGITAAQARAIGSLGRAAADAAIVFEGARGLDDLIGRLRALPGIGDWTAHVIAMRSCGEPDAFPAGDLGLARTGLDVRALAARAEGWRPWRAYAAMHLWTRDGTEEP